ncbi:MAG: 3'-5' exoribonuclease [Bacteroidetes bacterium]|nr:3'-5' exoribonuclease [Bacteroidota bacterium]MBS1671311.1 3'-5' exoribonuclease [Bacteroidota bacterium]
MQTAKELVIKVLSSYTAIDFETAQGKRWSICQVGLVRVENIVITEQLSILVQPPNNYYWNNFSNIHGITPEQTANAPTFNNIWHLIEPFITNQNVVAHNGFAFDFHCLNQVLEYYNIPSPEFIGHCTYKIFGDDLASLCRHYKINLNHHDALSDAKAYAELFKIHLKKP